MYSYKVPIHFYQEERKVLQKAINYHEAELGKMYKRVNEINKLLEGDERRETADIPSQSFGALEKENR